MSAARQLSILNLGNCANEGRRQKGGNGYAVFLRFKAQFVRVDNESGKIDESVLFGNSREAVGVGLGSAFGNVTAVLKEAVNKLLGGRILFSVKNSVGIWNINRISALEVFSNERLQEFLSAFNG